MAAGLGKSARSRKGAKPMQAGTNRTTRTAEIYDLIPPERGTRREPVRHARPLLIEDAVFEVVVPLHPRREHNDNPARSAPSERPAVAGVFLLDRFERLLSTLSPQAFMTLIASLFFLVFWLCGGFAALAVQPVAKPASPFTIERIFTEEIEENGMRLLAVGGMLRNNAGADHAMPSLSVVGEGGRLIGTIAPTTVELAVGESVRFFGRFQLPGGKSGPVTIFPAGH
jgi:hypothetical protein